jgi:hypothetical protein
MGGEDRKLLSDVGRAALGAVGLLAHPNELLEVRLALHADVLVDRHRGAVYPAPAGPLRPRLPLRCCDAKTETAVKVGASGGRC